MHHHWSKEEKLKWRSWGQIFAYLDWRPGPGKIGHKNAKTPPLVTFPQEYPNPKLKQLFLVANRRPTESVEGLKIYLAAAAWELWPKEYRPIDNPTQSLTFQRKRNYARDEKPEVRGIIGHSFLRFSWIRDSCHFNRLRFCFVLLTIYRNCSVVSFAARTCLFKIITAFPTEIFAKTGTHFFTLADLATRPIDCNRGCQNALSEKGHITYKKSRKHKSSNTRSIQSNTFQTPLASCTGILKVIHTIQYKSHSIGESLIILVLPPSNQNRETWNITTKNNKILVQRLQ